MEERKVKKWKRQEKWVCGHISNGNGFGSGSGREKRVYAMGNGGSWPEIW
jgi:hypothetical protein